uniref:Uncharacterized protein n=1 Tax=Brassica campestris TaxID=3711 RepID=A0A3P5ZY54_BRACM|nr:unnamed protein product [Brassica rapa]
MKRPMLRLHNPHLKNKVHGHSTVSWQELVLTKGWSLMPTLTQELLRSVVVLQRYIWNVLSPMHLWEATVDLVTICLEWHQ